MMVALKEKEEAAKQKAARLVVCCGDEFDGYCCKRHHPDDSIVCCVVAAEDCTLVSYSCSTCSIAATPRGLKSARRLALGAAHSSTIAGDGLAGESISRSDRSRGSFFAGVAGLLRPLSLLAPSCIFSCRSPRGLRGAGSGTFTLGSGPVGASMHGSGSCMRRRRIIAGGDVDTCR